MQPRIQDGHSYSRPFVFHPVFWHVPHREEEEEEIEEEGNEKLLKDGNELKKKRFRLVHEKKIELITKWNNSTGERRGDANRDRSNRLTLFC